MSVYDARFCVHYGNANYYTDDVREIARIDAEHGPVTVTEGYADREAVGPGHRSYGGIEGEIVTRRGNTLVEREVWERAARIAAVEDRIVQTIGTLTSVRLDEPRIPAQRASIPPTRVQAIRTLAEELVDEGLVA